MAKNKFDLTPEEKEIEASIARGEWKKNSATAGKIFVEAARVGSDERRKDARTNIRIEPQDLTAIKRAAQKRGMGYQTLIASVIHMYVNDELLEVDEVKKLARMGLLKDRAS
ncbi:antitoxin [Bdellovibrionota bacterium FG-1]